MGTLKSELKTTLKNGRAQSDAIRAMPVALRLEMMRIAMGIPRERFERMSVVEWALERARWRSSQSAREGTERP